MTQEFYSIIMFKMWLKFTRIVEKLNKILSLPTIEYNNIIFPIHLLLCNSVFNKYAGRFMSQQLSLIIIFFYV